MTSDSLRPEPELALQVKDLGEQGLLARLQAFCPAQVVGDDAAILALPPGRSLVVTSDVLVEGVHFSDRTTSPADVGWRAVAANLSDLAAMGATPVGITVGLGLPGTVALSWVEAVYQGMVDCLHLYQAAIVGGDICRAPVISLGITALGHVLPEQALLRSAAQPGDAIVMTGYHGLSRAGLELLLNPATGSDLGETDRALLIQAHQRPRPRLDVLPLLQPWFTQHPAFPPRHLAGMDSSDGLADAIFQICRASRVGAQVERQAIPIHPVLSRLVSSEQALQWALYGGEDFELVLCLPENLAQEVVRQLGPGAAIVGIIVETPEVLLVDRTGQYPPQTLSLSQGFQHF